MNTSLSISRLWIDGVLVDADFLDYNTLGTNLKVWGNDAGGPHGRWSSSVYHRYTITDLYDYKLPLLSKGYAEIWRQLDKRVWGEGVEALQVEVGFRSNVHFWVFAFLRELKGVLTGVCA